MSLSIIKYKSKTSFGGTFPSPVEAPNARFKLPKTGLWNSFWLVVDPSKSQEKKLVLFDAAEVNDNTWEVLSLTIFSGIGREVTTSYDCVAEYHPKVALTLSL